MPHPVPVWSGRRWCRHGRAHASLKCGWTPDFRPGCPLCCPPTVRPITL